MNDPMKIVIADDHPIVLMGVRSALQTLPAIEICGEAENSSELIRLILEHEPDLVLTDYHMPGSSAFGDGDRLLTYLRRHFPALKIIVLTMTGNPLILSRILSCGVSGILLKTEGLSDLCTAVEVVREGGQYVNDTVVRLLKNIPQGNEQGENPLSALTPKESEVLRLYINGLTVTEISFSLHRSIKTISAQKNQALKKLGITNEKDLFEYAIQHGLL